MRVIFHSITHYIGDLVITSIFHLTHRVHDTALYRFKTVIYIGNSTFQYNV